MKEQEDQLAEAIMPVLTAKQVGSDVIHLALLGPQACLTTASGIG